jgi:hypothetical protein
MRMNSIGRGVLLAHANLKTAIRHYKSTDTPNNLTDYEAFLTAERLGMAKRESCGCCELKFPGINLVMRVSQKAVIDIRKKWDPHSNDSSRHIVIGIIEDNHRLVVPRCYDQVAVCLFCSQFFHIQVRSIIILSCYIYSICIIMTIMISIIILYFL